MLHMRLLLLLSLALASACGGGSGAAPPSNDPPDTGEPANGLSISRIDSGSVTLTWAAVEGAQSYRLYQASEPIQDIENIHAHSGGDWFEGVSAPHTLEGLTNGVTWYFVLTAVSGGAESVVGAEVNATPVAAITLPQPHAAEVRMIELINRARRDPTAEVARNSQVSDLNQGLDAGTITTTPKQPLAFNSWLMVAARDHSDWMLETNTFSHTGAGGSSPLERVLIAGYSQPNLVGENLAVRGHSNLNPDNIIDDQHDGLFHSPGHRTNILHENYRELGIGQEIGNYTFSNEDGSSSTLPSSMVTQKYGRQGSSYFITGVVYQDQNNNSIYDVGEGMPHVVVTVNGTAYPVFDTGIYAIAVSNNQTYQLTFAGGSLTEPRQVQVAVAGRNVKVDVIVGDSGVVIDSW